MIGNEIKHLIRKIERAGVDKRVVVINFLCEVGYRSVPFGRWSVPRIYRATATLQQLCRRVLIFSDDRQYFLDRHRTIHLRSEQKRLSGIQVPEPSCENQ